MKNFMHLIATYVVMALLVGNAHADRGGGGDFGHAHKTLSYAKLILGMGLTRMSPEDFERRFNKENLGAPAYAKDPRTYIDLENTSPATLKSLMVELAFNARENFEDEAGIKFMDWGQDEDGTLYIEVLKNFYIQMGSTWNFDSNSSGRSGPSMADPLIEETMERLVKEMSHIWGYDDEQGSRLGRRMVGWISSDFGRRSFIEDEWITDQIPEYGIQVRLLETGNIAFVECEVMLLEPYGVECSDPIGRGKGYSFQELEEMQKEFNSLTDVTLRKTSGVFKAILGGLAPVVIIPGGTFLGCLGGAYTVNLPGVVIGCLMGVSAGTAGGVSAMDSLLRSAGRSWGGTEVIDFDEVINVHRPINYLFFQNSRSIDDLREYVGR
ncbi:MAG: hypothetical protein R2827_03740 [Bdellovibrionales bacterium]